MLLAGGNCPMFQNCFAGLHALRVFGCDPGDYRRLEHQLRSHVSFQAKARPGRRFRCCHRLGDPRMPSVRGLLRRGLTVQALRMLRQGPSRNLERRDYGLDDTVGHEPEGDRPGRATSYSGRDGANCRGVCHDGLISRTLCLSPDIRRGLRSRRGWLRTVGPYFWITRMRRP